MRQARLGLVLGLAAMGLGACATVSSPPSGGYASSSRPGPSGGAGGGAQASSGGVLHGTDKPYQVNGRWYYPHAQPDYDEVGSASWYGQEFHNRHTADGEVFDQYAISAAHKTLPLPCIVEVTNLDNGKRMQLRVNDRGPFVGDRILDVSRAAAEELGFQDRGLTRVRVRYIGPAPALAPYTYARNDAAPAPQRRAATYAVAAAAPAYAPRAQAAPADDDAVDEASDRPDIAPPPSPLVGGPVIQRDSLAPVGSAPASSAPVAGAPIVSAQAASPSSLYAEPSTTLAPAAATAPVSAEPDEEVAPAPVMASAAPTYAQRSYASAASAPIAGGAQAFSVQAAAFSNLTNAQHAVSQLAQAGPASIRPVTTSQGQTLYRVVLAGYPNAGAAETARAQVIAAGYGDARIIAPF